MLSHTQKFLNNTSNNFIDQSWPLNRLISFTTLIRLKNSEITLTIRNLLKITKKTRENKVCRKLIGLAIDRLELGERSAVRAIDRLESRDRSAMRLSVLARCWRSIG